jgi:hypothetical protein
MKSRITVAILVGAFLFAVAAAARAEGPQVQSGGTEPVSRVFDRPAGVLRASL